MRLEDGILYGGGVDRKVYAVDLETGAVQWSSRLTGVIAGGVLVSGDTVFVASSRPEGRVYALDRATGKRIWRAKTGPVAAPLALTAGTLVVSGQRGQLFGLDPATGAFRWRRRMGMARIAPVDRGGLHGRRGHGGLDLSGERRRRQGHPRRRVAGDRRVSLDPRTAAGSWRAPPTPRSYRIDPADLQPRWSVRVDAPVLGSPAAMGRHAVRREPAGHALPHRAG